MTLQPGQPAALYKRVIAGVIDYAFLWVLLWAPIKLIFFGDIDREIEFTRSGIGTHFLAIRAFVLWLFPYGLRDLFGGRGLGKWLVGIRVVDATDMTSAASLGKLILRNVTIWFSPVGMLSAHTHPDKMRFGDRLAGTAVVDVAYDPMSSVVARRLFKAMVFLAAGACCIFSAAFGFSKLVRNSEVHETAVAFVTTYEPLHEVTGEVSPDNVNLALARYGPSEEGAWALLVYTQKIEDRVMQIKMLMTRKLEGPTQWSVADASGAVTFKGTDTEKQRMFAFVLSKDFHRFLTQEEMRKIFQEKRPPMEVIPELKETDNAPAAPAPLAPKSATPPTPKPAEK